MELNEDRVLCVANKYKRSYFFNPKYSMLPTEVQQELQILCVKFTESVGGILILAYAEDGSLDIRTEALDSDVMYDEIAAGMEVSKVQKENEELFRSLELFYHVFIKKDLQVVMKDAKQSDQKAAGKESRADAGSQAKGRADSENEGGHA